MLESAMVDAVYNSAVGLDAVYSNASGSNKPVRVLLITSTEDLLQAGDLAVRGVRAAVRVRKCELCDKPAKGDRFVVDGELHINDQAEHWSRMEWICYVSP